MAWVGSAALAVPPLPVQVVEMSLVASMGPLPHPRSRSQQGCHPQACRWMTLVALVGPPPRPLPQRSIWACPLEGSQPPTLEATESAALAALAARPRLNSLCPPQHRPWASAATAVTLAALGRPLVSQLRRWFPQRAVMPLGRALGAETRRPWNREMQTLATLARLAKGMDSRALARPLRRCSRRRHQAAAFSWMTPLAGAAARSQRPRVRLPCP
mmetsp:Transcript_13836/g.41834  ORF Transcript_13836/g.41834 Transcript_13836/m.41834 type:complete len:215 (+) Transcript_13836:398-1042(+)